MWPRAPAAALSKKQSKLGRAGAWRTAGAQVVLLEGLVIRGGCSGRGSRGRTGAVLSVSQMSRPSAFALVRGAATVCIFGEEGP